MKDRLFQSYIKKADKIKERQKRDMAGEPKPRKQGARERRNPYGLPVYWAMHSVRKTSSRKESIIIVLLGGPSAFAAFYLYVATVAWPVTPFLYYGRVVMAGIVFAWFVYIFRSKIYSLFTYPFYINWDKKLHFRLSGWEELVSSPRFTDLSRWRTGCSITVTVTDSSKEFKDLIHSVFYIFCHRTRAVYEAFESDNSEPWDCTDFTLRGRCNCSIAGYIYAMIKKDLNRIAGATGAITEVAISCNGEEKEFSTVWFTSDSEGTSS